MLGKPLEQFFASDSETDGWAQLLAGTHEHSTFRDLRCFYRDVLGNSRICRLAGRPIVDATRGFIGYRGTATDITEEVEAQARANHLALHDALTGLANRVLFHERLDGAFEGKRRDTRSISVLCLDLDHFKEVNDTLGHGVRGRSAREGRRASSPVRASRRHRRAAWWRRVRDHSSRRRRAGRGGCTQSANCRRDQRALHHRRPGAPHRRQHRGGGPGRDQQRPRQAAQMRRHRALPRQADRPRDRAFLRATDGQRTSGAKVARV